MSRKSTTRSTLILFAALIFGPVIAWAAYAIAQGQHPFELQPPPGAHAPTR